MGQKTKPPGLQPPPQHHPQCCADEESGPPQPATPTLRCGPGPPCPSQDNHGKCSGPRGPPPPAPGPAVQNPHRHRGIWSRVPGGPSGLSAERARHKGRPQVGKGRSLTGHAVDGAEGSQHPYCSDGREAHVVSIQGVLHHAGGGQREGGSGGEQGTTRWRAGPQAVHPARLDPEAGGARL